MDLTTAKALVIADSREQNPDREITDAACLAEVRAYGREEIEEWIENEVVEGDELVEAYRAVIAATDDEIAAQRGATRAQTDDDADTDCL
ncbi:hypothetical protein [Amycolatopsis sp. CA-128772]|uniref:hypothetical protein n=1 Tax=Amycolatopsis sp. CA-128772 TaxID=2073159 RepID=UPI0018EE2A09|nr:hypothetical protein [Amycolatopsis sp. CA-128772]